VAGRLFIVPRVPVSVSLAEAWSRSRNSYEPVIVAGGIVWEAWTPGLTASLFLAGRYGGVLVEGNS